MAHNLLAFALGAAILLSFPLPPAHAQSVLTGSSADARQMEARQNGKVLLTMAIRVAGDEPHLYENPVFKNEQAWTLTYQGFVKREELGDFKRLMIVQPRDVRFQQIEKAFVKYGQMASTLLPEVSENIAKHRKMYVDAKDEALYVARFNQAIPTMLPGSDGLQPEFKPLSCDYVSQPTNALWFSLNAMRLVDEYGQALFGAVWTQKKAELQKHHSIRELGEFQQAFANPIE